MPLRGSADAEIRVPSHHTAVGARARKPSPQQANSGRPDRPSYETPLINASQHAVLSCSRGVPSSPTSRQREGSTWLPVEISPSRGSGKIGDQKVKPQPGERTSLLNPSLERGIDGASGSFCHLSGPRLSRSYSRPDPRCITSWTMLPMRRDPIRRTAGSALRRFPQRQCT